MRLNNLLRHLSLIFIKKRQPTTLFLSWADIWYEVDVEGEKENVILLQKDNP